MLQCDPTEQLSHEDMYASTKLGLQGGLEGGGGVTLDMRAWLSMCDHALHMCVWWVGGCTLSVRALVYKLGAASAPVLGSPRAA